MARCEDFPCCGHELGCCPDFDEDTGRQLNMKCTCGATLPIDNPSSLCNGCLNPSDEYNDESGRADYEEEHDDEDDYDEDD